VNRLSRRQSKKSLFCTDDFNIVGVAGSWGSGSKFIIAPISLFPKNYSKRYARKFTTDFQIK
jgi:hypothetical protein